jgi:beta-xylosidase
MTLCLAAAWPAGAQTYTNPVGGDVRMGDPFVARFDEAYYLYGTNEGAPFLCWTSEDLVHWTPAGQAWTRGRGTYGKSSFWAPEVFRYRDRYWMTYSCARPDGEGYRLCLAVADRPTGPFMDLHAPWLDDGTSCIDAHVFFDADGTPYLYYDVVGSVGQPGRGPSYGHLTGLLYAVRLAPDLSTTVGERVLCVKADQEWELVTTPGFLPSWCNEGAFVILHDDTYYLTYSSGFYADPRYAIGYATAPTPLGPWTKSPTNPLAATDPVIGVSGPGHGSITASPDGSELFLVYHAHADPANPSGKRTVNIDRLAFDGQGRLRLVGPTRSPQPLPAGATE